MSREPGVYGFHNPLATLPRRAFSNGHIQRLDGGGTFAGVESAEAAWLPLLRITDLCRPACAVLIEHQRAALHHHFRANPNLDQSIQSHLSSHSLLLCYVERCSAWV